MKENFDNYKKLQEKIDIFKKELINNLIEQKEEFLKNKENEAVKIIEEIEEKINYKIDNDLFKQQKIYNSLLGIKLLTDIVMIIYLQNLKENKKDELKHFILKIQDINQNRETYEEIKEDLSFLGSEKIVELILNSDKNIKELRLFTNQLVTKLKEAVEISNKNKKLKEKELEKVENNLQPEILKIMNEKDKAAFAVINYLSTIEEKKLNKKEIEQVFNDILSKEEIKNIIDNKDILFEKLKKIDELNYNLEMNNESAGNDFYLIEKINNLINEIREIANLNLENITLLEKKANLDKAIRTAFIFEANNSFNKENIFLVKEFINKTFNTNLDLNDFKNIQKINQKIFSGELQNIDFKNLQLNKKILKDLATPKELIQEKELEELER